MTRRQAQAAKAKSGRPQTISKDKIRQVLERWVNRHLQGSSSQDSAKDPFPSPKRSRGGVDELGRSGQPQQPPPTHEGVAGSPKSSATQPWGGRLEHGPSQPPEPMGEQLACLEPGLGHQPMDGDWPPPEPTGGRLDPAKGTKEEVPGEPGPGQTSSPSETAAPGSYIRRFLGPAKSPGEGESGQAGSAAVENSEGESGESGSANEDEEVAGESESGTPDSGQFS